MGNFFKGMGNGFLSLVGAGSVYDPLSQASSKLSSVKDDINQLTAFILLLQKVSLL
jgi:hypothetical protein